MTHPHIRTFHGRHARMNPSAAAAIERLWNSYSVDIDGQPLDLEGLFPDSLPAVLEIGSGMGEATVAMAAAEPSVGILAVDVHTPGLGTLLRDAEAAGLTNIRVARGDAVVLLRDMIAPDSLAGIRAYFPDPWPKQRQHKRRLIRPELVNLAASRLRPGGIFHTATDWDNYADQMLAVLSAEPLLRNEYDGFASRPAWRPVTRFERRGLRLGHRIHDLIFRRV